MSFAEAILFIVVPQAEAWGFFRTEHFQSVHRGVAGRLEGLHEAGKK